jgi:hypothetical protein
MKGGLQFFSGMTGQMGMAVNFESNEGQAVSRPSLALLFDLLYHLLQ